jgi:hypothetical protein
VVEQLKLGTQVLKVVETYKYLGFDLDRKLSWAELKTRLIAKAKQRVALITGLGLRQGLSVEAGINAWQVLVRPVLEYGIEV